MGAGLQHAADEHLKAVGDHYDFLLGSGGQKGMLATAQEQLEAVAEQYEQRGNVNAAYIFRCRISDLETLETQILKAHVIC